MTERCRRGKAGEGAQNILTAAQDKKIETSITIDGKDLSDVFSNTANGVYQYSQLIGINGINDYNRIEMQAKSINQAAFSVNWDARAVVSLNKEGELTTSLGFIDSKRLKDMMTYEYKGEKFEGVCIMGAMDYDSCTEKQRRLGDAQSKDFDAKFKDVTDKLKIHGYEFQNGKVVKSLTREEKIRLGQIARTQAEADKYGYVFEGSLSAAEKQITNCYEDTGSCGNLLKQDFKIQFNDDKSMVTLSKIISNGRIDGKNSEGEYKSGTQVESRNITLARVAPVVAPKGKDLFDQWTDEDWKDIDNQNEKVFTKFQDTLEQTSKMLAQNTAVINSIESKNEKLFQERKKAQEEADSFLKDMVLAYLSGGMAGIKGAIKGKIEDKINMELAKAFIQATGGSPDQVQLFADAMGFMRGKVQERNIKNRANTFSINNPIRSMENYVAKVESVVGEIPVIGAVRQAFGALELSVTRAVMGPRAYEGMMNNAVGAKNKIAEIKANEKAITKRYVSQAVVQASGLPAEVVGQILNDYEGSQKAKKIRSAVNANPIANLGSQVYGAIGGIIKTAGVAFGAKERDMQRFLNDASSLQFAGNMGYSAAQIQNSAYLSQAFGMKAQGTTYTSNIPKDEQGILKELATRKFVTELAKANGWDEDVVNAALRGEMGRLEQQKADRDSQKDAARSTAITAVTTLATLGAAGALGSAIKGVMGSIGQFVGATGDAVAKIGAQVVKTAVQVIDGSRNGVQGMLAGLANGALGALTMGGFGGFDGGFIAEASNFLQNTGVGLGISYNGDAGWGGMVGVGGTAGNLGIQFSQHGDTTVSGGVAVSQLGVNLSGSYNMQTGSHTAGLNYNISNNFRIGASHSSDGGLALTGGINASNSGSNGSSMNGGLNFSYGANGLSTSLTAMGVSLGTNTANGFQAAEQDWMGENIAAAQANVQAEMDERLENAKKKYVNDETNVEAKDEVLKKMGLEGVDVADLSPDQLNDLIKGITDLKAERNGITNTDAIGTSRGNILTQFAGGIADGFSNIYNFYNGGSVSSHLFEVDSGGNIHPRTCFVAGTKIHTQDGLKNIEDVRIGDVVLSKSDVTGEISYKRVVNTFIRQAQAIYKITFEDGTILETTWNHPFRRMKLDATLLGGLQDSSGAVNQSMDLSEWTEAKELKSGDLTFTADGKLLAISSIEVDGREETVYNFEVEDFHTYFVGEIGVWVHNQNYGFTPILTGAGFGLANSLRNIIFGSSTDTNERAYVDADEEEMDADQKAAIKAGATTKSKKEHSSELNTKLVENEKIKYYGNTGPGFQYCQPELCQLILDTAKDLPNGLYTNDASLAKGKEYNYNHKTKTGWHSTHKHGDAMDIKFATKNDVDPSGMKFNEHDEYSQPKTIKLIDTLGNNLPSGYNLKIYFNDTSIIKHYKDSDKITVEKKGGHDDHLHIILRKDKSK